jgi:putative resolvase
VGNSVSSRHVSISAAANLLGLSQNSVRKMTDSSELAHHRTLGGHRRISVSSINEWMGIEEQTSRKTLIYARVSSKRQRLEGNLDRQASRLRDYCLQEFESKEENLIILKDCGSGLTEQRQGYQKLLELVISQQLKRVVCEYPDRISRWGVRTFEILCEKFGTEFICTNKKPDQSFESELSDDVISVITVFSARTHGCRGALTTRMPIQDELRDRITQLHEDGLGQTKIARIIKEEGFRCDKTGKPHAINSVRKTLKAYEKLKKATSTLTPNSRSSLKKFLKESCSFSDESRCFTRPLFKAYSAWCKQNNIESGTSRKMTEQLQQSYETGTNSYRFMFVKGLALKGNPLASEGPV